MKKYFIDEAETFAITEPVDVRVELMGWEEFPIVYIDNFYQNPDKVRNLALRFPSDETDMTIDMEEFVDVWTPICEQVFGVQDIESLKADSTFSVRTSQSKDRSDIPHMDGGIHDRGWSGVIYLNKGKECKGGTGFYTYKGLQVEPDQSGIDKDGFELVHLAEMKYNRFIMYPSNILHMAVDEESWFEEDLHRLIQVFYLT
tara:strand:+ start:194 stop:796 length:603 start_codon:yes stop_codon:yes gene_type:complete